MQNNKRLIEKYFGNSLIRKVLSILSKRNGSSSTLERALVSYNGGKLSLRDLPSFGFIEIVRKLVGLDIGGVERINESVFLRSGILSYVQAIAHHGVTTPQRFVAPHHIVWNLTNLCNIGTCEYCYQNASINGGKGDDELSLEQKLDLIDQFDHMDVGYVIFSGGEPLTEKNIFKIVEYTARKGIGVGIGTNGVLLREETAKRLKESGLRTINISLNGAKPETHDGFIGKEGYWEKSIRAIENAKKYGLRVESDSIVSDRNFSELEDLIKFEEKLGLDFIKLFPVIAVGRGKDAMGKLNFEQGERVLQIAYNHFLDGTEMTVNDPRYLLYLKKSGNLFSNLAELTEGCYAGRIYCAIQPDGIVTPCIFLPVKAGDVKEESFSDIWQNSEVFKKLRDRDNVKGTCGECEDKLYCGGCRARAYGEYGDYLASDPSCNLRDVERKGLLQIV